MNILRKTLITTLLLVFSNTFFSATAQNLSVEMPKPSHYWLFDEEGMTANGNCELNQSYDF